MILLSVCLSVRDASCHLVADAVVIVAWNEAFKPVNNILIMIGYWHDTVVCLSVCDASSHLVTDVVVIVARNKTVKPVITF